MTETAPNTNQIDPIDPIDPADAITERMPAVETAEQHEMNKLYAALENDYPTDEDVELMTKQSANLTAVNAPEKGPDGKQVWSMHYYYQQQPNQGGELIEMHPAYAERLSTWKPRPAPVDDETPMSNQVYFSTVDSLRAQKETSGLREVALNPQLVNYTQRLLTQKDADLRTISGGRKGRKGEETRIEVISAPELMQKIGLGALESHAIFEELQAKGVISKQATTEDGKYAADGFQINKKAGVDDGGKKAPKRLERDDVTTLSNKDRAAVGLEETQPPEWYHSDNRFNQQVVGSAVNTGKDYGKTWGSRFGKLTGSRREKLDREVNVHHRVKTEQFNEDQRKFYSEWDANRLTKVNRIDLPQDAKRIYSSIDDKEIYPVKNDPYGNVLNYLAGKHRPEQDAAGNQTKDVPYETTDLDEITDIMIDQSPLLQEYAARDKIDLNGPNPDDPEILRIRDEVSQQVEPFAKNFYDKLIKEGAITETVEQHNGQDVTVGHIDADKILALRLDRDHEKALEAADRAMDETFRTNEGTFNSMYDDVLAKVREKFGSRTMYGVFEEGKSPLPDVIAKKEFNETSAKALEDTIDAYIAAHNLPETYRSLLKEGMRRINKERRNEFTEIKFGGPFDRPNSVYGGRGRERDRNNDDDDDSDPRNKKRKQQGQGQDPNTANTAPRPRRLDIPKANDPAEVDSWEETLKFIAGEYGGTIQGQPIAEAPKELITRFMINRQGEVARRRQQEGLDDPMPQVDELYDIESKRRAAIEARIINEEVARITPDAEAIHKKLMDEGIVTEVSVEDARGMWKNTFEVSKSADEIKKARDDYIASRPAAPAPQPSAPTPQPRPTRPPLLPPQGPEKRPEIVAEKWQTVLDRIDNGGRPRVLNEGQLARTLATKDGAWGKKAQEAGIDEREIRDGTTDEGSRLQQEILAEYADEAVAYYSELKKAGVFKVEKKTVPGDTIEYEDVQVQQDVLQQARARVARRNSGGNNPSS